MSGLQPYYGKKYTLESSENFEEYMKALGVNVILRKIGNHTTSTLQLFEENGVYTLRITSTFKSGDTVFKLGEEFDETTPDGRKVKTTMTIEDNKLIQVQKGSPADTTLVRHYSDTEVIAIYTVGDVSCTRKFKLVVE